MAPTGALPFSGSIASIYGGSLRAVPSHVYEVSPFGAPADAERLACTVHRGYKLLSARIRKKKAFKVEEENIPFLERCQSTFLANYMTT